MKKRLLENIEAIPALPETVQAFERLYQDENATSEDFERLFQKDPLITANIFRVANSPMYGLKRQVSSLQQAISLLGRDSLRAFVLGSVINSNFTLDLSAYNMTKEQFVLACERQLALTINWLIRKKSRQLSKLAPAAFMVDLGRVIISKTLIDEGQAGLIQEALANGADISHAEKEACGAQTTDVTATLFNQWNLDPDIIHVIRYSDDPEGTIDEDREMAAHLKAVRECILPNGEISADSIAQAKVTIEEFGLDMEGFERALERVAG